MPRPPSANQAAQRATKRRHLDAFLARAGIEADVVPGDRPDFVLVVGSRRIGLEHQELTEEDLASTEENLTWLEERLRAELLRLGADRDLHIAIVVDPALAFFRQRRDLQDLARRVAELGLQRARSVRQGDDLLQIPARELFPLGILGPRFVYVGRTAGLAMGPIATVSRVVGGPGVRSAIAAIRDKEQLLPAYAAAHPELDAFWLLLITGDGYVQPADSAMTQWIRTESVFERVYLVDLRTGDVQRLDAGAD